MIQKSPKTDLKGFSLALLQAIGVHLLFLALFVASSWDWAPFESTMPPVRVTLVDMGPIVAEREAEAERQARLQAQREEEERALEQARQAAAERLEQERLAQEQAAKARAEERARAEAEAERQARIEAAQARERREAQRRQAAAEAEAEALAKERELAELRAQREAAQRAREEQERQLQALAERRLAQEQARRDQIEAERLRLANAQAQADARQATLREEYILTIQELIRRNWTRPPTTPAGMTCTVRVFQIPGGEIISAELVAPCNADQVTRGSIETAISRVSALPYRGYESVFAREIEFAFRYNGQ